MIDIVRRALLGDAEAQRECTKQGMLTGIAMDSNRKAVEKMEQRLIDANLFEAYSTVIPEEYRGAEEAAFLAGVTEVLERINTAPTIDPKNLPVAQELRKQVQSLQKELGDWNFWYGPVREQEAETLRKNQAAVNVMRKRCEKIIAELRAELAQAKKERDTAVNDHFEVKQGDKVYQQNGVAVYELEVKRLILDCGHIAFDESAIGSSIYLSEEAAKTALEKEAQK